MRTDDLRPGDVVWAELSPVVGREQAGRRPVVIISGPEHLELADTLAIVVPVTSVDRGWDNHVELSSTGLPTRSWAMTEQVRTISRSRIVARSGRIDPITLIAVRDWVRDHLDL
ncbi:MAG TPA: type II toxin-antitoxin system PemK/MazF family toxin [Microbacterium sp.]|nr:type II toxin-antitoxin system PemK/MazF family toxin [Microbacterium sp.]